MRQSHVSGKEGISRRKVALFCSSHREPFRNAGEFPIIKTMQNITTDAKESNRQAANWSREGHRRGLMVFCPRRFLHKSVTEISVTELKEASIEAVLLDLDNTLVPWQSHDITEQVHGWLEELKAAGIKRCLVSNTRFGKRLVALSKAWDIPYVRRAWKPRKKGFEEAMQMLGADPTKTIMIGDQMFTDVWGGNRVGVYTVMVKPMAPKEFFGTKISRTLERVLLKWFRHRGHI